MVTQERIKTFKELVQAGHKQIETTTTRTPIRRKSHFPNCHIRLLTMPSFLEKIIRHVNKCGKVMHIQRKTKGFQ